MNEIKYYGKIGNMYISGAYTTANKASLSKDIKDAFHLDSSQQKWVKEEMNAKIIKVTINYEEV